MAQIVRRDPHPLADDIARAVQNMGVVLGLRREDARYQDQLKRADEQIRKEDDERARRNAIQDADRRIEMERDAAAQGIYGQGYERLMQPNVDRAGAVGAAAFGAMGMPGQGARAFMEQKQAEVARDRRMIEKMDPAAARMYLDDKRAEAAEQTRREQGRLVSQALIQLRTQARDLASQGIIAEDGAGAIREALSMTPEQLAGLDPQSLQAVLAEVDRTEKYLNAAVEQHAEDMARADMRSRGEQEVAAILEAAQDIPSDQRAELVRASGRMLASAATMTPSGMESAIADLKEMAKSPTLRQKERITQRFAEQGVPYMVMEEDPDTGAPRPVWKTRPAQNYAEAQRMAEAFMGEAPKLLDAWLDTMQTAPSRRSVLAPQAAAETRPAPVMPAAGGNGKKQPTYADFIKKNDVPPGDVVRQVAEAVIAKDPSGLPFDPDSLPASFKKEIEALVKALRAGKADAAPFREPLK